MNNVAQFHPTSWTLVMRAAGSSTEAKRALADLCAAYYAPVVSFLRREHRDDDAARDMAHAFFESLLDCLPKLRAVKGSIGADGLDVGGSSQE